MNLVLSHIYFANALLGFILLIEVLVRFKRPLLLKGLILSISIFIFLTNSLQLYSLYFEYNRVLNEIFRILLLLAILNLLYIIYYHKIKMNVLIFSIVMITMKLISITYILFILKIDNSILLNEMHFKNNWLQLLRIIFAVLYFSFCVMIYMKITRSFNNKNIYYQKIKYWSRFIIISFYLLFICFIIQFIFPNNRLTTNLMLIVSSTTFSLLLLFRPSFLNKTNLDISLSDKFNKVNLAEISLDTSKLNMDIFTVEFFHKAYFSNKNSSVEDFSSILGVSPEELKAFVSIHYNLSFTDLVNKSRVQMFVDLIQNSDNENLTIEGLSVMAGFGTRQNFHKAFKKFHGGNPSDLLRAVQ